jgi:hypothetical protein
VARANRASGDGHLLQITQEPAPIRELARRQEPRLGGDKVGDGLGNETRVMLGIGQGETRFAGLQLTLTSLQIGCKSGLQLSSPPCEIGVSGSTAGAKPYYDQDRTSGSLATAPYWSARCVLEGHPPKRSTLPALILQ